MSELDKWFIVFCAFVIILMIFIGCIGSYMNYQINIKAIENGYEQIDGNWVKH